MLGLFFLGTGLAFFLRQPSNHQQPQPPQQPSLVLGQGVAIGQMRNGDDIVVGINQDGEVRAVKKDSAAYAIYILEHINRMLPKLSRKDQEAMEPQIQDLRALLDALERQGK